MCPGNFQEIISSGGVGMFRDGGGNGSSDLGRGTFYGGRLAAEVERHYENYVSYIFGGGDPAEYSFWGEGSSPTTTRWDEANTTLYISIGSATAITSGSSLIGTQNNARTNRNCLQNAIVDTRGQPASLGIGRRFDANPGPEGQVFHDGTHALSPPFAAFAATLPTLVGEVIYTNVQEYKLDSRGRKVPALYTVDVRPTSGNFIAVYKDLKTVSIHTGQKLVAGDIIGTVRPAGDPMDFIGLHIALVRPEFYESFRKETKNQAQQNRLGAVNTRKMFIDPLGPDSPIKCSP